MNDIAGELRDPADLLLAPMAATEPAFDAVVRDFLLESYAVFRQHLARGALVDFTSLGQKVPWLYRLTFRTQGFRRDSRRQIHEVDRHTFALRFLPDYLRRADRFEMIRLIEPADAFHPNISPSGGGVCIEIYPGESLTEIAESLHDLVRWRLRQYDERDALNHEACAWGRENVDRPIDDRPLFGRRLQIQLEPLADER